MAYGAALERRFGRKSIEGSNPSPSAILFYNSFMNIVHIVFDRDKHQAVRAQIERQIKSGRVNKRIKKNPAIALKHWEYVYWINVCLLPISLIIFGFGIFAFQQLTNAKQYDLGILSIFISLLLVLLWQYPVLIYWGLFAYWEKWGPYKGAKYFG